MSMRTGAPFEAHKDVLKNIDKYLQEVLNVTVGDRKLVLERVDLPSPEPSEDYRAQSAAKSSGQSLSRPVYAHLVLKHGSKSVDRKKMLILSVPAVTRYGTYLVNGGEYAFPTQKRLLPGVYTSKNDDGSVTSIVNTAKGLNYKVELSEDGVLALLVAGRKPGEFSTVNLHALLLGFGVSREDMQRAWTKDAYATIAGARGASGAREAMQKLYDKMLYHTDEPAKSDSLPDLAQWVLVYLGDKEAFDADNMAILLGKPQSKISPQMFVDVVAKMIEVAKGNKDSDAKESLLHSSFEDVGDFVMERLNRREYREKIKRTIEHGLGRYTKVDEIVYKDLFQAPLISTFTQTSLARMPKQNNPMDISSTFSEVTLRGEGGISMDHAVTKDVRAVDPSHFLFLDPIHTPEGGNVGTTLHMASGARKSGKTLVAKLRDVKTGKVVELNPRQIHAAHVAAPESYLEGKIKGSRIDGMVEVMHQGDMKKVKTQMVQYVMLSAASMLDLNSLAVPFMSNNNGTRGMTASKMQAQAKPLKYREAPLIRSAVGEKGEETIEGMFASNFLPKSPVDGTISKVSKEEVAIKDGAGKIHLVGFPKDYWLNEGNFVDTELSVKVGDKVKAGQILGDSTSTKDGALALGVNLRVAYVAYKGYNHEDGIVISETAAKKLTSLHAHQSTVPVGADEVQNVKKWQAYFPVLYLPEQLSNLDDEGVIKEGARVNAGDPMVVKMRRNQEDVLSRKLNNVSRLMATDYRDTSYAWEKDNGGIVAEVRKRRGSVFIVVKTEEEAREGDKACGRYGNKGVITSILADDQMPKDEEGRPMEILLNPSGVPGRMNLGQVMEVTASNIAEKTGKPYIARPFGQDNEATLQKELKQHKLKDHGNLIDPEEGDVIEGVLIGKEYILKLEQQVEKKMSARSGGAGEAYGMSGQPSGSGGDGGRAVGLGEIYTLLAHGANANLRDMFTWKGDAQPEAWRAMENGYPIPPVDVPHSSQRLVAMMRGMGVDLAENGSMVRMTPFLDRDVKALSAGEIKTPGTLRAKDLKEENGGLFDIKTTGGRDGDKWSHIKLARPMPHPTFEKSILDVTGIKDSQFQDIMAGVLAVKDGKLVPPETKGAKTGGEAISELLAGVNVKSEIKRRMELGPTLKGSELNSNHRCLRVLKNFSDNGIQLKEMVVATVPVLPPKFRPATDMPDGSLSIADVNEHYKSLLIANNQLKELALRPGLGDQRRKLEVALYTGMRGTMGFDKGLVQTPNVVGLAATIAGAQPKHGVYLAKTLRRKQDASGTGVIAPDPKLSMDEAGIPEEMAWKIFQTPVITHLKNNGFDRAAALDQIGERTPFARRALELSMERHPVIINRAPTLHRGGVQAFQPKLVPGRSVKLPVEVLTAFNADFDGDTVGVHAVLTPDAIEEAHQMMPSKNLYAAGRGREALNPQLSQEYIAGLYRVTRMGKSTAKSFMNPDEAIRALKARAVKPDDVVSIKSLRTRTTPGLCLAMEAVPPDMRDYKTVLGKKQVEQLLMNIEKKHGTKAFLKAITEFKHVGRKYAYLTGLSVLLSDLKPMSGARDQIYMQAERQVAHVRSNPRLKPEEAHIQIIKIYADADAKVLGRVGNDMGTNSTGQPNNLSDMLVSGARGNPHQIKQMVGAVGLMMDHRNRTIQEPVRGNYAEGLGTYDYWKHTYSQRKGMIDKSQSVIGPGALSKELTNTASIYPITSLDCNTKRGRLENVDKHLMQRLLARQVLTFKSGTIVDSEVVDKLSRSGMKQVLVRSPLTCEQAEGVCSKCYGQDEFGKLPSIGVNVGIREVQAMTERAVQLPMKSFHSGGVASADAGLSDAFSQALQVLRMPDQIKAKATLATLNGRVDQIRPTGFGSFIIMIGGKEHQVGQGRKILVRLGEQVTKGQQITSGMIKAQEQLALTNLSTVQGQVRDDLESTFSSAGVKLHKRTYELMTKGITEQVRVTDPGDSRDFVSGDYTTLAKVQAWNSRNAGKRPIKYTVELSGSLMAPHRSEDFARRMALGRISGTLVEGVAMGYTSDRDKSPFSRLSLGPGTALSRNVPKMKK